MAVVKGEMSFEEIKGNRDGFLALYNVSDEFAQNKISWDELLRIGEDFEQKRQEKGEFFQIIQRYIAEISKFENVHSYRYRIKKTGSLLAKIIKKSVHRQEKITVQNYFREITDLLGIRILYVFKEDYWPVHTQIMAAYKDQLVEDICLKLKAGDDESIYAEILNGYPNVKVEENKLYRSIHYTLNANTNNITQSPKLEIQTRTIFEEGWSEINHKLVYKKGKDDGQSLKRISTILSELVGTCDTIGGLMKYVYDQGVESNSSSSARHVEESCGDLDKNLASDPVGDAIRRFLLK